MGISLCLNVCVRVTVHCTMIQLTVSTMERFHSSQGRHKSEGASTTPTSPIVGFPSPVAVGNHSQPANMAGNGAIMSMPAAGQEGVEKQNEWAHYDPGAVYSNVEVYTQPANMASNGATTSVGQEGREKLDELANFDPGAVYTNIEVIQGHLQVYMYTTPCVCTIEILYSTHLYSYFLSLYFKKQT